MRVEDLSASEIIGDWIVDVVDRIDNECVILEAETIPTKCIQKVEKIKNAIADILSGKIMILEESGDSTLLMIKRQLAMGKPIKVNLCSRKNALPVYPKQHQEG